MCQDARRAAVHVALHLLQCRLMYPTNSCPLPLLPASPRPGRQDPPFGIHLCGPPDYCVAPGGPVVPVHEERVRPYRPLPTFRPDTLVQHYLRSEEMKPFWEQVRGWRREIFAPPP